MRNHTEAEMKPLVELTVEDHEAASRAMDEVRAARERLNESDFEREVKVARVRAERAVISETAEAFAKFGEPAAVA